MHRRVSIAAVLAVADVLVGSAGAQAPTLHPVMVNSIDGRRNDLVGISWLVVDSAGGVYLSQDEDGDIRHFDAQGKERTRIGREGAGPGEFRMMSIGGIVAGNLWVSDPILRRTTYFGPEGRVIRSERWLPGIWSGGDTLHSRFGIQPRVVLDNRNEVVSLSYPRYEALPSWWPHDATSELVAVMTPKGRMARLVAALPAPNEACVVRFQPPGGSPGSTRVPFCPGSRSAFSAAGQLLVIADQAIDAGTTGQVQVSAIRFDGTVRFVRTLQLPAAPISRAARMAALRSREDGAAARPAVRKALHKAISEMMVPDNFPPVDAVLAGRDGSVWLRRGGDPAARVRSWVVLEANGDLRGTVALPGRFTAHQVERSGAWGVLLDRDDVPSVVHYRIE